MRKQYIQYRSALRIALRAMNTAFEHVQRNAYTEFQKAGATKTFMSRVIAANHGHGIMLGLHVAPTRDYIMKCRDENKGKDLREYVLRSIPQACWVAFLQYYLIIDVGKGQG